MKLKSHTNYVYDYDPELSVSFPVYPTIRISFYAIWFYLVFIKLLVGYFLYDHRLFVNMARLRHINK